MSPWVPWMRMLGGEESEVGGWGWGVTWRGVSLVGAPNEEEEVKGGETYAYTRSSNPMRSTRREIKQNTRRLIAACSFVFRNTRAYFRSPSLVFGDDVVEDLEDPC